MRHQLGDPPVTEPGGTVEVFGVECIDCVGEVTELSGDAERYRRQVEAWARHGQPNSVGNVASDAARSSSRATSN
jgi:hypothetical protein